MDQGDYGRHDEPGAANDDLLAQDPPPAIATASARFLIALLITAALASAVIRIPETVRCTFVLASRSGVEPLRAPHSGSVKELLVYEGAKVRQGDPLLVLLSDAAADRSSELQSAEVKSRELQAQLAGIASQLAILKRGYLTNAGIQRREIERLRSSIALNDKQLQFARDVRGRSEKLFAAGGLSVIEVNELRLEAEKAGHQLQNARKELEIAQLGLARVRSDYLKDRSRLLAERRALKGELESSAIKIASLQRIVSGSRDNQLMLRSPFAAAVVRLGVKSPGAYVQQGDLLLELVAEESPVHAQLTIPANGIGRIKQGQRVKLRFDAFPYQRFGAKQAEISWISPAGLSDGSNPQFVAHAVPASRTVRAGGQQLALLPGMTGSALVVVGRVRIISYAFEPLRELRENFAM